MEKFIDGKIDGRMWKVDCDKYYTSKIRLSEIFTFQELFLGMVRSKINDSRNERSNSIPKIVFLTDIFKS